MRPVAGSLLLVLLGGVERLLEVPVTDLHFDVTTLPTWPAKHEVGLYGAIPRSALALHPSHHPMPDQAGRKRPGGVGLEEVGEPIGPRLLPPEAQRPETAPIVTRHISAKLPEPSVPFAQRSSESLPGRFHQR